jgi:hypothetical protein
MIEKLVQAILSYKELHARQILKDAKREGFDWSSVEEPTSMTETEKVLAACLVELFTVRFGMRTPTWTSGVSALIKPLYLDSNALFNPHIRAHLEKYSPECFKSRNIFTYQDYLNVI